MCVSQSLSQLVFNFYSNPAHAHNFSHECCHKFPRSPSAEWNAKYIIITTVEMTWWGTVETRKNNNEKLERVKDCVCVCVNVKLIYMNSLVIWAFFFLFRPTLNKWELHNILRHSNERSTSLWSRYGWYELAWKFQHMLYGIQRKRDKKRDRESGRERDREGMSAYNVIRTLYEFK